MAARTIAVGQSNGRPIGYRPVPAGTPRWGAAWKKATAKWYLRSMNIGVTGSNMPNRYNCYDLDPTYRNAFGQPLLRLTYNFTDNDRKIAAFVGQKAAEIAPAAERDDRDEPGRRRARRLLDRAVSVDAQHRRRDHGREPARQRRQPLSPELGRARTCSCVGASAFPHNSAYNPTGPVGALAYWTADAIKSRYRQRPGPLV